MDTLAMAIDHGQEFTCTGIPDLYRPIGLTSSRGDSSSVGRPGYATDNPLMSPIDESPLSRHSLPHVYRPVPGRVSLIDQTCFSVQSIPDLHCLVLPTRGNPSPIG